MDPPPSGAVVPAALEVDAEALRRALGDAPALAGGDPAQQPEAVGAVARGDQGGEAEEEARLVARGDLAAAPRGARDEAAHPGPPADPRQAAGAHATHHRVGGAVVGDGDHRPEQAAVAPVQPPPTRLAEVGDHQHRLDQARRGVAGAAVEAVDAPAPVDHGERDRAGAAAGEALGGLDAERETSSPGLVRSGLPAGALPSQVPKAKRASAAIVRARRRTRPSSRTGGRG